MFSLLKKQDSVRKIEAKKEHPREFEDYEIIWHVDGCKEPEVI